MLCDISQVGVRYDCDSLYALVVISNKAKLVDHCPKTFPSWECRSFDDEASQTASCLDAGRTVLMVVCHSPCVSAPPARPLIP